ncbi:hypothetical protein ACLMJK_008116 [Lecanora helva]
MNFIKKFVKRLRNKLTRRSAAPRVSEDDPREPPPPATPLQFPSCSPQGLPLDPSADLDVNKLFSLFGRTGPRPEYLRAFNISVERDVECPHLVPAAFLPPASWLNEFADPDSVPAVKSSLSNGYPAPGYRNFYGLAKEMIFNNTDAFKSVRRNPRTIGARNPLPVSIINSRKFWNGLADMAEYWDTSLDHYSELTDDENDTMDIDEGSPDTRATNNRRTATKQTYTGRRRDTGSKMPNRFREETVTGLVEVLARLFHCTLDNPTIQPKLQIHNILIPLPYLRSLHRIPINNQEARNGIKQGPILGVLCRDQIKFREDTEAEGQGRTELLDLLKESGLLALLAQRRAREGNPEVRSGENEWWTTQPRWGGGAGGEFGSSDEKPVGEEALPTAGSTAAASKKKTAKANRMEAGWRSLRPAPSLWEKNVVYQAVGKEKGSPHDDIYLISSVNHHISIVHARIHSRYIDHLTTKNPRQSTVLQEPWYELSIQHTKWFDLFLANDRIELLRGLWGVFSYMMRTTDD